MTKLAVAIFHGIGTHEQNFADLLIRDIQCRLVKRFARNAAVPKIVYRPIRWGTALDDQQADLCQRVYRDSGLGWQRARGALIAGLGDAIAYHSTPGNRDAYDEVHARVAEQLTRLADEVGEDAPLCVIAHSFGSIVASNYFFDRQRGGDSLDLSRDQSALVRGDSLATLITLGSPLALWSMRFRDYGQPVQVPAASLLRRHPRIEGAWLNLYDPNDVLGYPLQQLNAAYAETVVDFPVKVGGILRGWNPLSHLGYWTNGTVLSAIAASLSVLWRQAELLPEPTEVKLE